MLSSGVKDTDHGANSCQIGSPLGDYSRPFAKVRRQLRKSGAHSLYCFDSFISLRSRSSISFFLFLSVSFHVSLVPSADTHHGIPLQSFLNAVWNHLSVTQDRKLKMDSRGWGDPFHTAVYPLDLSGPTASNTMQGLSDKDHKDREMPPKVIILRLCFCLTSGPRAGLTAHRLPLIECDRFSH